MGYYIDKCMQFSLSDSEKVLHSICIIRFIQHDDNDDMES